jgi:signal peptidase I
VKHRRLRVALVTGFLVAVAGATWVCFAPIALGGSTAYVVTHGISMEPRFHTGDLAIVRAASSYRVGQIVAYHSSLLHEVVLHRIVGIRHGRYIFKGDNNDFFDPVHPTRSELIGRLWIHLPRVGLVLEKFRTPFGAAILAAGIGLLLVSFEKEYTKGRRSRMPERSVPAEMRTVKPTDSERPLTAGLRDWLMAAGVAVVVFAALCLFAFDRPFRVAGTRAVPYKQQAAFTYSAKVEPGAVYPKGDLVTGDPIFLNFVDNLDVGLHYRLLTPGAAHVTGTSTVALRLTGPTGWSRTLPLVGEHSFTNGQFSSTAVVDLTSVKSLLSQVQSLTGVTGSSSTVAIVATVHLVGHLSGSHLRTTFSPVLNFQMGATQLQPEGAAGNLTGPKAGFMDTRSGSVTVASSRANPLRVFGHLLGVKFLRVFAAVGLLLSALAALALGILLLRLRRLDEAEQIGAQYRHLIVPLADDTALSGQEPVDLASMEALVRFAEHCGRLILHSQHDGGDSYLLNDGDTVYRYRVGETADTATGSTDTSLPEGPGVAAPLPADPVVTAPPPPAIPSISEAAAVFKAAAFAAAAAATEPSERPEPSRPGEPPLPKRPDPFSDWELFAGPIRASAAPPRAEPEARPDIPDPTPVPRWLSVAGSSTTSEPPPVAQSTVPPPAVVQPAVPQSVMPQPVMPQPVMPQPVMPQPTVPQPTVPQSVAPQPAPPQHAPPQPEPQAATPQPAPSQPAGPSPEIPRMAIPPSPVYQPPPIPHPSQRTRPASLATFARPQVPDPPQISNDPAPPPSVDASISTPPPSREELVADMASLRAHASQVLFDVARRWRSRLT